MDKKPQTSEEHQARREAIVKAIKELRPDAEIGGGKFTQSLVYYTVCVHKSQIKVGKEERNIFSWPDHTVEEAAKILTSNRFLTKAEARNAIEAVLPKAQEHFQACLKKYQEAMSSLNFSVGYTYDGDTHGIYDEYEYINFKMDGFDFEFEMRKC